LLNHVNKQTNKLQTNNQPTIVDENRTLSTGVIKESLEISRCISCLYFVQMGAKPVGQ